MYRYIHTSTRQSYSCYKPCSSTFSEILEDSILIDPHGPSKSSKLIIAIEIHVIISSSTTNAIFIRQKNPYFVQCCI